jgi:xylulokinase
VLVNITEGAAFGAALLAGVGAGTFNSVDEAVAATIKITDRTAPIPANAAKYERLYPSYRALYPALKDAFHSLPE